MALIVFENDQFEKLSIYLCDVTLTFRAMVQKSESKLWRRLVHLFERS